MSRVDIIVPCYKYGHYLRGCIQSVLSQPVHDLRVLILDDASPDDTPAVAKELVSQDCRIAYRRHDTNHGHIATYNEGLEWATGEATLLLSADDLLTPGALARTLELLDAHSDVALVWGRQVIFEKDDSMPRPCLSPGNPKWKVLSGAEFLETVCASGNNPVMTPTAVVRTGVLKRIGGYRSDLPHTADMELWCRCAVHGAVGILDVDQAFKRMHGRNMQLDYLNTALGDICQRKAAFDVFFQHFGDAIADSPRLRRVAAEALADEAFWAASGAFDGGDSGRCQELLDFALDVNPQLPSSPQWQRLQWKRRVGAKVWSALRPVVELVRGR
jgi:glycosyltransferase involved in cell wall biosynthesis